MSPLVKEDIMSSTTQKLIERGLATGAPPFLKANVHYETIMGSHAYGVADTSIKTKMPDYDVYGFAIPPKEFIFKHLTGWIPGFGPEPPSFDQWQRHSIFDQDALGGLGKEWDLQIFNIVKYFELCRENNPNMIDSLFTPENCVVHCTQVGRLVRDNRRLFLSKLCWKKFRGYASAQLKKCGNVMESKEIQDIWRFEEEHDIPRKTSLLEVENAVALRRSDFDSTSLKQLTNEQLDQYHKLFEAGMAVSGRFEDRKRNSQDNKFLYHLIRLYDEAEQIILEGDLDLQRARETMKAVRRGEWTTDQIQQWAVEKDKAMEAAYVNCKLPDKPPVEPLRQLLLNCLEEHYGSLEDCVETVGWAEQTLKDVDSLLEGVRAKLYN